ADYAMSHVTVPPVIAAIDLHEAALCGACSRVFRLVGQARCPLCTSEQWVPLERFFIDRPAHVAHTDVLHHAGNGLTPARPFAERLSSILAARGFHGLAQDARRVVDAIDATMRRLRALGPSHPHTAEGVSDGHQQ